MSEDDGVYVVHLTSSRLTQNISLHKFRLQDAQMLQWRPSQSLELHLPDDFDPISRSGSLSQDRRCLTLTPCNSPGARRNDTTDNDADTDDAVAKGSSGEISPPTAKDSKDEDEIEVITRNGFMTFLISLPRFTSLCAQVTGVRGGFDLRALHGIRGQEGTPTAVAGGTGICVFLSLSTSIGLSSMPPLLLLWSIHINDWGLVRLLLDDQQHRYLDPAKWKAIKIFLTRGSRGNDIADYIPLHRLNTISRECEALSTRAQERARVHLDCDSRRDPVVSFHFRHMTSGDFVVGNDKHTHQSTGLNGPGASPPSILFCGSRSLEWQVKMWAMTMSPRRTVQTAYNG
jgi:hypothetical protein